MDTQYVHSVVFDGREPTVTAAVSHDTVSDANSSVSGGLTPEPFNALAGTTTCTRHYMP